MFAVWLFTLLLAVVQALHVEVPALSNPVPVCIRDFVGENQLVVVNIKSLGYRGDGQNLDVVVTDSLGNVHGKKKNIVGNTKVAFTSHSAVAFDVCFTNAVVGLTIGSKEVELDIELGAAARDWNAVQAMEKLKPNEMEVRRTSELLQEVSNELSYLQAREERMRNTNELTNSRIKWFSMMIILVLVGLGVWQIQYLRTYFKAKHII